MSEHYIDKGIYKTFRYEARGQSGDTGYSLGRYRTKEKALEAVLRDKREQEQAAGSWGANPE